MDKIESLADLEQYLTCRLYDLNSWFGQDQIPGDVDSYDIQQMVGAIKELERLLHRTY